MHLVHRVQAQAVRPQHLGHSQRPCSPCPSIPHSSSAAISKRNYTSHKTPASPYRDPCLHRLWSRRRQEVLPAPALGLPVRRPTRLACKAGAQTRTRMPRGTVTGMRMERTRGSRWRSGSGWIIRMWRNRRCWMMKRCWRSRRTTKADRTTTTIQSEYSPEVHDPSRLLF